MTRSCGSCRWYQGGYKSRRCIHPRLDNYFDILPICATVHVRQTKPEQEECELWERQNDPRDYEAEVGQ